MIEKVSYAGWETCYRMSNGIVDLVVTADVGPRIIRFGFVGKENEFGEIASDIGKVGGNQWRLYGGHRLWHAPEAMPRTYSPDNQPVEVALEGDGLTVRQDVEPETHIRKALTIRLSPSSSQVQVIHTLTNEGLWAIELAPWAVTVMAKEGVALIPLPAYIPHEAKLTPACPLVLWHYTDLSDKRWTIGKRVILLRQDPSVASPQKIGIGNYHGWVACYRNRHLFVKRYEHRPDQPYPDFGSSTEVFTNAEILELETLGPLVKLQAGQSVSHQEDWFLFDGISLPEEADQITEMIGQLLEEAATQRSQ